MKELNVCLRKWASVLLTAVFLLAWAFPVMAASGSAPLGQWNVRYQATGNDHTPQINGIAYGNNTFVALGGYLAMTSPDGANWTEQQNPELKGGTVGGITFGNGIFVAVGAKILTSPDGVNWTERVANVNQNPNVFQDLLAVAYGNGVFVAVGNNGAIMTSSDGITWTSQNAGTTDYLSGVAYGNGTFVVIGTNISNESSAFTSPDGVSWKETDLQGSYGGAIAYGNNTFVAFGTSASGYRMKASSDGMHWTNDQANVSSPIEAITYGGNTFLAVEQNAGSCTILISADGISWTSYNAGIDFYPLGATYGNGTFVIAGYINNNGDQRATILQSAPLNGTGGQPSPAPQPSQGTVVAKFLVGQDYYYMGPGDARVVMDAVPYIDTSSGRTLVPVRYLGDALSAQTDWDANTQTVTVTKDSTTISIVIGSTALKVNGQVQTLDQAPVISNGRTYLPARWVAEALGYTVSWNASSRTVTITQGN